MSDFNFKSQICTDKNQSERLLALGLKKETADMVHSTIVVLDNLVDLISEHPWTARQEVTDNWYPAWSLHRLIEMINEEIQTDWKSMCLQYEVFTKRDNLYDNIIDCIEWLIKEGYFPKEYLV